MGRTLTAAVVGIPSRLRTAAGRRALALVTRRIRDHFPADYARLLDKVLAVRPLTRKQAEDGTQGEWKASWVLVPEQSRPPTHLWGASERPPGYVLLNERSEHLVAVI